MIDFDPRDGRADGRADGGDDGRGARLRDREARVLDGMTAAALAPRTGAHVAALDDVLLGLDEPVEADAPHAPLARYLPYQIGDWLKQRGLWIGLLALAGVYIFWYNYDAAAVATQLAAGNLGGNSLTIRGSDRESVVFGMFATQLATIVAFVAAILGAHGIVSQERERGYQRFLFAKPVGIVRYYLQKLAVAMAGSVGIVAATMLVTALVFTRAVPVGEALALAGLFTVSLGGLTFLLSTLVRFEGAAALALAFAALPLRELSQLPRWEWLETLRWVLPPVEQVARAVTTNGSPGGYAGAVLWALAYGAVCIAAGVAILRRRTILT